MSCLSAPNGVSHTGETVRHATVKTVSTFLNANCYHACHCQVLCGNYSEILNIVASGRGGDSFSLSGIIKCSSYFRDKNMNTSGSWAVAFIRLNSLCNYTQAKHEFHILGIIVEDLLLVFWRVSFCQALQVFIIWTSNSVFLKLRFWKTLESVPLSFVIISGCNQNSWIRR